MSSFRAVNTTLTVPEPSPARMGEDTTPTTPRPGTFFPPERTTAEPRGEESGVKTPTRESFGGVTGQLPLPGSPVTPAQDKIQTPSSRASVTRGNSHRSTQSVDSQDIDMEDEEEGQDGSDNDSVSSESRPAKKKKGQRFFCTDFPPCTLSFTRSEHLARHIRKHTGERPFQCHCSRRFSRLDNLRQHAQTVHVNEDIPGDSLAATGTRFQRQIRTDRVRPPSGRSRASTISSQGGHSRGHSRNLSTSSIASTASTMSTVSTMSQPVDNRRRPPPLAMANDGTARAGLSIDTYNARNPGNSSGAYPTYGNQSPGGFSTPTSATFSTGPGSPRFPATLGSPMTMPWGSRTPGRRLSVPSGANPFQSPQSGNTYSQPFMSPLPSSTSSTFSPSGSGFASPTSSVFSEGRRDSTGLDSDWRRRTWHPGTYTNIGPRPATSGLSYQQTVDAPRPSFSNQPAASQVTRLPGIESFDHAPPPTVLQPRQPSPMQVDQQSRPVTLQSSIQPPPAPDYRNNRVSWDNSLNRGLVRLDLTKEPQGNASPQQVSMQAQHPSYSSTHPTSGLQPVQPVQNLINAPPPPIQTQRPEGSHHSQPPPVTPRKNKRQAWYNGPLPTQPQFQQASHQGYGIQRTSPDDSGSSEGVPTPSGTIHDHFNPAIVHSNGDVEGHTQHSHTVPADYSHKIATPHSRRPSAHEHSVPLQAYQPMTNFTFPPRQSSFANNFPSRPPPPASVSDTTRLDALVAVATREDQAVHSRG